MSKPEGETRNPKYLLKDKVTLLSVEKKIFHMQPMQIWSNYAPQTGILSLR